MNAFAELPLSARVAFVLAVVVIVGAVLVAFLLAPEKPDEASGHEPLTPTVDPSEHLYPELDPAERHWVKRGPAGGR